MGSMGQLSGSAQLSVGRTLALENGGADWAGTREMGHQLLHSFFFAKGMPVPTDRTVIRKWAVASRKQGVTPSFGISGTWSLQAAPDVRACIKNDN
jgi:hypothetical protein